MASNRDRCISDGVWGSAGVILALVSSVMFTYKSGVQQTVGGVVPGGRGVVTARFRQPLHRQ